MLVGPYPLSTWNTYLGTLAQEHRINIISNNLANAGTTGFKREVPVFEGFMVKATKTDFSQGHLQQTGNSLDLALTGPGFFQIDTPFGVRYTRDGAFTLADDGTVVTVDGYPVVGAGAVPPETVDLVVDGNGEIRADGEVVGQIQVVEFADPSILAKDGYNRYVPKVEGVAGVPALETEVQQGCLEGSNVQAVMESVTLIDTLRTYEVFQKVVHSFQEADQKTINEVGRLT